LYYESSLHARTIQLPVFSTFEVGFNAVVVVVYRPGSCNATQSFFDDFCDLLERLSTLSAPLMIAGDFNIHVDDATDIHASKLSDILSCHSLQQHVNSPTHVHGHTLDLLITRDDQSVAVLPVDPPLLSNYAFVVADCSCPLPPSTTSTACRVVKYVTGADSTPLTPTCNNPICFRHHLSTPRPLSAVMTKLCITFCTNMHHLSPSECL